MKKVFKSFVVVITMLFLLYSFCFKSNAVDFKSLINNEEGTLFEKIIAECIGGIAQTIFDFTTTKESNIGFKDYDTLIFNNRVNIDNLSPFTSDLWNKTMNWYKVFAIISGSLILIAVFILAYKTMLAGMNTAKKNEVKESLMRLCFGGIAISLAPLFIKFLLFINNSLVYLLVTAANSGTLESALGENMLASIRTGNAITTALVIAMFIYLFVKINIKFIVRQFTIIIFTIFTPIACGLWIINKNVTAASIWAGQIIMNIFMQFIYCFLFLIYLAFLPSGGGWAVSLIWAMMILPIADALQNCLQNLTSRIAGIDNEQMTNRVLGMGTMLGFGIGAIQEQFKTPSSSNNNNNNGNSNNANSGEGFKGIISRAKAVVNPAMNLSAEKDYNGNVKPIIDVIPKENNMNSIPKSNGENKTNLSSGNNVGSKSIAANIARGTSKATTAYLGIGAKMAEGNFQSYSRKSNAKRKNKFQNTEYINKLASNKIEMQKSGDSNEHKE